jgi:hypothetical protein
MDSAHRKIIFGIWDMLYAVNLFEGMSFLDLVMVINLL